MRREQREPVAAPDTGQPDVQTDLALEALPAVGERFPGVHVEEEQVDVALVTRVVVEDQTGARYMGKPPGNYITIEADGLRRSNRAVQDRIATIFARELCRLMPPGEDAAALIVGLGNWNATPDALGPRVVNDVLITRHLCEHTPPEKRGALRPVSALAPGVLGLTGIETGEIIRGVVDRVQPSFIIAVDALASRSIRRIGTTIQLADTGIHPGSGVGNRRVGITSDTLGVPVLAIGVPTVVHARTIAWDAIEALIEQLKSSYKFFAILGEMQREDKRQLIDEVLSPAVGDLMVTPKEIDVLINEVSRVVAGGLNVALHPGINPEELARYVG